MSETSNKATDILSILNTIPGCHLILLPDVPRFTIVGATDAYLSATYLTMEEAIGLGVFEALTDNPNYTGATGVRNRSASLESVVKHKGEQRMSEQRYDVLNPNTGQFEYRVWSPSNKPVFDSDGQVQYIIHSVDDTTEKARLQEEKRLTEQRFHESESRFRKMVEQAPIAILLSKGEDVVIESVNRPMLGFMNKGSAEEVLGKKMVDALPELEGQPALQTVMNVQQTGVPFKVDEQPVNLVVNGTIEQRYFTFSYTPVVEEGKVMGVLHVANDVTHQVITRRQVEEREAKYRTLFASIDQGFCIIEVIFDERRKPVDYRFLEVNPVFENQTGLKDAAGKTIKQLAPGHEDHWFRLYGKVALSGESMRFVERADALQRWYDVYAFRIGEAGENRVAVLFTDITQRRKAEEDIRESETRFRSLADESPMFVFIIDADPLASVSYWNKTWLSYTGQTYEEALGRAWDGVLHADDVHEVMHHYVPAFEKREPYFIPAIRVRRHDGEYRWHSFKGNPRFSAAQQFEGYIGVGFDIHEQKVTEENLEELVAQRTQDLQRANTELKRSNQNLEEFAYAASHDLKEPVRKIHFFTHQLKDRLGPHLKEGDMRSFNRIENASERMNNLIDDLLLYSHVSQRPHEMETVDLNEKVQRVLEDLELDIAEKKAVIHVGKLPAVQGYRRQLQQLFQNLLSNALKYSKVEESPKIDITASVFTESGTTYHVILVKDNGIGFEQQYADKIFQMFSRLHGKAEYSGTGVGLSIVKKVVENHHGFIRVKSSPGVGSTFEIYLPV